MVQIGGQSGVTNNIPDGKIVLGSPAIDANQTRRIYVTMQHLPEMRKKIKALEKQLDELKKTQKPK
jgi:UDP-3-O-[3-hydroxymyristoyl] glucosamine N-acyltransferase